MMQSILFFLIVCLCFLERLQSIIHLRSPSSIFSYAGSDKNKNCCSVGARRKRGPGGLLSWGLSIVGDGRVDGSKSKEEEDWIHMKTSRSSSVEGGSGLERLRSILQLHGGGKGTKEDKGDEGDEYEDLLDDEEDDDDDVDEALDDNRQQSQMLNSISDMWIKTPPITQAYVGSSMLLTLAVFLLNKNIWPELLNLNWGSVVSKFQFWRPFTAFLFFGPLGLNYVLTIQFVWTYMAQLEKLNYNKPEEFFMMLLFGAVTLIVGYAGLGFSTQFLGHNLSTFLVYIWARTFEGTDVNVMDLFCLKAELLPWFFCVQTYLLEGEIPFADILGIIVGHLYHYIFLEKKMKAIVPSIVKDFFSSEVMRKRYARFKDDFE